jgi:hypothetical protein
MSSSDYTALRKFKEIQGSCNVNEIGDPLSSSWFDIPVGNTTNCSITLGTGPTGSRGPIGYTGSTGPRGVQGIPGPTNGGIFAITATMDNGFDKVTNNGFSFTFGNVTSGFQIGSSCKLNYIAVRTSEQVDLW